MNPSALLLFRALVGGASAEDSGLVLKDDRLDERPGLDASCVGGTRSGMPRRKLEIPLKGEGEVLRVTWSLEGGERGHVIAVTLNAAAGSQTKVFTVGSELSRTPVAGPDVEPVTVGRRMGAQVEGSVWTVPVSGGLTSLVIEPRMSAAVCVYEVEWGPERWRRDAPEVLTSWVDVGEPGSAPAKDVTEGVGTDTQRAALGSSHMARVTRGDDGHLYQAGQRVRFWGVEIEGLPEAEHVAGLFGRLQRLGFNLVRFTGLDADWGRVSLPEGARVADPERLARLDQLLTTAEQAGLYLWFEGIARGGLASDPQSGLPDGWRLRPFWSPTAEAAMIQQLRGFWSRTRGPAGALWLASPAVLAMTVSPEHSLASRWGLGLESLPVSALAELDLRWNDWLKQRYGTEAALAAAWAAPVRGGLGPGESLGTVRREPLFPQLAGGWPEVRGRDLIRFYRQLERELYARLSPVMAEIGPGVHYAPTETRGRGLLQSLYPNSVFSDVRLVWDRAREDLIEGESLLARPEAALSVFSGLQAERAAVVEVRHPAPNPWRSEAPWVWAVLGSVQDADVVLWEGWGARGLAGDPGVLLQMPGAALAFREFRVDSAVGRWELPVPGEAQEERGWASEWEAPRMTEDLGIVLSTQMRARLTGTAAPAGPDCRFYGSLEARSCPQGVAARSYAGPSPLVDGVGWWADPGVLIVDRPDLRVRVGPPGEAMGDGVGPRSLTDLRVSLDRWAAVAWVDTVPLGRRAGRIGPLGARLTVSARQARVGEAWAFGGRLLRAPGSGPVLAEVPKGTVAFRWPVAPVVRAPGSTTPVPVRALGQDWWEVDARVGSLEIGR